MISWSKHFWSPSSLASRYVLEIEMQDTMSSKVSICTLWLYRLHCSWQAVHKCSRKRLRVTFGIFCSFLCDPYPQWILQTPRLIENVRITAIGSIWSGNQSETQKLSLLEIQDWFGHGWKWPYRLLWDCSMVCAQTGLGKRKSEPTLTIDVAPKNIFSSINCRLHLVADNRTWCCICRSMFESCCCFGQCLCDNFPCLVAALACACTFSFGRTHG